MNGKDKRSENMKKTIKKETKKIQAYTRAVHDFVKDMEKEAKARRITKKEIAKAIGRSATVIYNLEDELSKETALLICKLFNWERKDKFTEEEWALLSKGQPIVGQKEQTQDTDEKLIEIACLKDEILALKVRNQELEEWARKIKPSVEKHLEESNKAGRTLQGILNNWPKYTEVTLTLIPEGEYE